MNDLKAICIRFEFNKAFLFMRKEVLKLDFKYDNQAENSKKMTGFVGTKENDFNYFIDVSKKRTINQKSNLYILLKGIEPMFHGLFGMIMDVISKEFDPNESECFRDKTFDFFLSISQENNITESINIKTRKFIKQVKMINNTGLGNFINGNFYDYTENMKNNNYIIINGINVNKNRVKFIDVYSEPPVSNADAVKQVNPVS